MGLSFDDNGVTDLFIFFYYSWRSKVDISLGTVNQVIPEITKHSSGGTNYAPAIKLILDEYIGPEKKGFMFAKGGRTFKKLPYPVFVMYFTDGENGDRTETEQLIQEAAKYGIFFQFIGIGNASMPFLEKLDTLNTVIDSVGFFRAQDLDRMSDTELYNNLLSEFFKYIPKARALGYFN